MSLRGNGVTSIFLGARTFLVVGRRVEGFLVDGGVGDEMDGAGVGTVVLRIQLVNSSRIFDIAVKFLWWLVAGASLIA